MSGLPPYPLEGKVAVVSGASGGIGVATAEALANAGAHVVVTDLPGRSQSRVPITQIARELEAQGLTVAPYEADLSDEASVEGLLGFAVECFGGVDIVHNNAALPQRIDDTDVTHASVSVWDTSMKANLRTQMLVCKHAIPKMIERGGGSIINMSSSLALAGDFHNVAYSCAKAAVLQLTRHVATVYGSHGIRCNAITPGLVETPGVVSGRSESFRGVYIDQNPMRRLGRAADVANMVMFLASDWASYVNGQIIGVDGGLMTQSPPAIPAHDALREIAA